MAALRRGSCERGFPGVTVAATGSGEEATAPLSHFPNQSGNTPAKEGATRQALRRLHNTAQEHAPSANRAGAPLPSTTP